jgi:hypothetical protein
MKKRLIILIAIVLAWTIMACSLSELVPQQQARVTNTPTRTPKPTFTATATPTHTVPPSPTPTPTQTPTATPVPTETPVPSDTPPPTAIPTDTETPPPSATPTATLPPTPRPTRKPTNTPIPAPTKPPPPPFTGTIARGDTHCGGYRGVTGYIKHANGAAYPGVAIGVWSDAWQGRVGVSEADGKYELPLTDVPAGKFKVAVVKSGTCGQRDGELTAVDCQRLSNIIEVTTTDQCTGVGANQVTTINFTGP